MCQSSLNYFQQNCSVYFLHLRGLVSSTFHFLEWGQIIIVTKALIIVINAEAKLDHAVDTPSELCGFIKVESRCEKRGVKEKPDKVLDCLIRLVSCGLLLELSHDRVLGVHLHCPH